MQIKYEAKDGKIFDNQFDCEEYELKLDHPFVKNIIFYNENNHPFYIKFDNILDDLPYQNCFKLTIHNENEFQDFIFLSKYCGWCEFYDYINSPGTWIRYEDKARNGCWKKEK